MEKSYRNEVNNVVFRHIPIHSLSQRVQHNLEDLLYAVQFDSAKLSKKVEFVLHADPDEKNILLKAVDALASIFGAHIVSNSDCVSSDDMLQNGMDSFLTLNADAASEIVGRILTDIDEDVGQLANDKHILEDSVSSLNRRLAQLEQERDALLHEQEAETKKALHAIQRILAQNRELKPMEENEENALLLYFDDLGLTWSWDAEAMPNAFTAYKLSNKDSVGVRLPCIFQNGKLALKGLRYYYSEEN